MDTYPLRNLVRPRCAERAKPGRGKPVLIMHIGFLACFHAISLERSRFSKIATLLNLLVSLISRLVACSETTVADKQTDRQTDRQTHGTTTVTLAAHAPRVNYVQCMTMYSRRERQYCFFNSFQPAMDCMTVHVAIS